MHGQGRPGLLPLDGPHPGITIAPWLRASMAPSRLARHESRMHPGSSRGIEHSGGGGVPVSAFLAIDFETANHSRTSACAVGLVYVEGGRVVAERTLLIRPPRNQFTFTHIHGLSWDDVRDQPSFAESWPQIREYMERAEFLVAHNAAFDRGVLARCCEHYGLIAPARRFVCTVQLARARWNIRPTRLPDVCQRLGIPLNHHEAGSDARACAEIALRASQEGWRP